ncbi:MAG: hypothetical protein DRI65_19230 [Chloroflexota bacterium]|nr:MAG: hypothetical protein DRI65_19230 [Chloroflexota bacterium]
MANPLIKNGVGQVDIQINQGSDLDIMMTYKDPSDLAVDLTDWTAEMDIRLKVDDATPIIELSTMNSRIVLGGVTGTINLLIDAADTEALSFKKGVYDLELTDTTGKVIRLIEGKVTLTTEVTRDD